MGVKRRVDRMVNFRKEKSCPSSEDLLDLVREAVPGDRALRMAVHLRRCDFCQAELEFYCHYPPVDEAADAPPTPRPIRELAEALMTHDTIHISRLENLFGDVVDRSRKSRTAKSGS